MIRAAHMEPGLVSLLIQNIGSGGAEKVAVNIANYLAKRGKKVHLVVIEHLEGHQHFLSPQVTLINLNCKRRWCAIIPFTKYLLKEKPASVLAFLGVADIIAIIATVLVPKKPRLLISEHSTYSMVKLKSAELFTGENIIGKYLLKKLIAKYIYPLADEIIAVSKDAAEDLENYAGYQHGRVKNIYNPVIFPELFDMGKQSVPHPWLKDTHASVILAVGRLSHEKNFALLIKAFAKIRTQCKAKLMIIGEGPEREALQQLINNLGINDDVALVGFQKNPYAYMSRTAALVLSSNYEGLSNVLIEALACGSPVISTDCKSGSREILADGKYGILVPVGNIDALATAMKEVLANPEYYKNLAMNFKKEALYQYTTEYAGDAYLRLLFQGANNALPMNDR